MDLLLPVVFLLGLLVAITSVAFVLYNYFRMSQEVRASAEWWVNLVPFLALGLPGSLSPKGGEYRAKASRWLLLAALGAAMAGVAQLFRGA
jgi:hypothetical protein